LKLLITLINLMIFELKMPVILKLSNGFKIVEKKGV